MPINRAGQTNVLSSTALALNNPPGLEVGVKRVAGVQERQPFGDV